MITRNDLTTSTTGPTERKMVMTRFFDAPPELVFKAYIDPNLIPRWWGPKRLTTIVVKMDVRPGGIWRFIQRESDGNEYIFNGMYHEIVPPERLVYTFEFEGMPGHVTVEIVTFEEEHGSKTKLTSESFFQTIEDRDIMVNLRAGGGVAARMDRLNELLKYLKYDNGMTMTKGSIITNHKIMITRVFDTSGPCYSKCGLSMSSRRIGGDKKQKKFGETIQ